MQLGGSLPVSDIGTGPAVLRDYAQAAEGLGFAHLLAPDHVLGANPAADHEGRRVGTTATAYHDPFVLFGFLAGCTQEDRLCLRRPDPGAAPGGAGRQAGGLARRAVRRPVPARHRGRLERGRVHRAQRGFPQPRPALGRAGAGHAGAVGRAACQLRGRVPPHRRRRHQPAPGFGPRADLVWRPCRGDVPPLRALWRRLHAAAPIRRARRRWRRSTNCAA